MNPTDYVQTRCQRCGAQAWGHLSQTVPCNACGQPIAPMASSAWNPPSPYGVAQPPGAQAFQQPAPGFGAGTQPGATNNGAPPMASSGGPSVNVQMPFGIKIPIKMPGGGAGKVKMIGSVVGVGVLAVVGSIVGIKMKGTKAKKGMLSYSAISMDAKKIDADKMIGAVESTAKTWKKDAAFWSINLQAVHADGTVDASGGGAQVEYVSPSGVTNPSKKLREDSIKKFSFGPSGVDYSDIWGASDKWELDGTPPTPHCGIKNVTKQLASKGLTGDKTVRITFDPQFADSWSWHVLGEDPKIDAYFSMEDCSPVEK
jgi:ribosomal protein L37E